jgi:DegV family protein with EDD domain
VIIDRDTTALVVDSTADLSDGLLHDPNVTVVPLTVFIDGRPYLDGVDLTPEQFFEKLVAAPVLPTTSQPSPGTWLEVFRRLRERYRRVYSIHMNGSYGGSYATACLAAAQIDGVTPIDSQLVSNGEALLVDRLLARLDAGTPEDEFAAYIEHFRAHETFFFLIDDLYYAHTGGRLGRASYLVGNALHIKPILFLDDGITEIFRKARGWRAGLRTMRDGFVERTQPDRDTHVMLGHALNPTGLADLQELVMATDRRIHLRPPSVVGSVIGVHAGPRTLGLAFIQE